MRQLRTPSILRNLAVAGAAATFALAGGVMASTGGDAQPTATNARDRDSHYFSNPVLGREVSDPVVIYEGRSYYYVQRQLTGEITVQTSPSLRSLASAPVHIAFRTGTQGSPCCNWWAPEIVKLGDSWYMYVAADNGNNANHRMQVLKAKDPVGPYTYLGELRLPSDKWAIDGTALQLADGGLYFLWSGLPNDWDGPGDDSITTQNIYITRMKNPWTANGPRVLLSEPTYEWERHTPDHLIEGINEGPAAVVRDGKVFVTYSASGCWTPEYSLGLLSADVNTDLLAPTSWTKSPQPVFQGNPEAKIYATGHNHFFSSPDGKQTWSVYRATHDPRGSCGHARNVYVQRVRWHDDGTPDFGEQLPITARIPLPAGDPGSHP